ncbi:MAG: MptD family putative ECF transporter S component [Bacillota bacterium]|nr:MptD family putative ECF transporter S component [Bacillota bacterium]
MEKEKITIKDLIMTGIFSALYFILSWIVGMPLGFMVVTYLAYPFFYALIGGVVTMFFMTKCPKPWLTFIFTLLPGLLMFLMGYPIIALINYIICSFLAELVRRKEGFKSKKGMKLSHIFISLTSLSGFLLIYTAKDIYYEATVKSMGEAYATQLTSLPIWVLIALYISVIIGAILGGKLGEKILNKHFKALGIE